MPCRECSNFDKIQCSLYQVGEIGEQNEQKYLLPRFSHAAPVGVGPSVFSYFLDYASPFCVAFIESHTTSFDLSPREFATCMRAHIPFSSSAGIRQYGSRLEQPALPVTDWQVSIVLGHSVLPYMTSLLHGEPPHRSWLLSMICVKLRRPLNERVESEW